MRKHSAMDKTSNHLLLFFLAVIVFGEGDKVLLTDSLSLRHDASWVLR